MALRGFSLRKSTLSNVRAPVELRRFNPGTGMEKYRALCGTQGTAKLHQTGLDPDDIVRLPHEAANAPTRVFLLKADELEQLASVSNGMILDRGVKNPAKPLAHYLSRKTGLVRLRADYQDPGQAERGIRALLAAPQGRPQWAVFFIGISDSLFEQLWRRADGALAAGQAPGQGAEYAESDDFRALIDQHPNLKIPPALKDAFLGNSPAAERVRRMIVLAAKVDHPVLIEGETGTGKEVAARQIHELGRRRAEKFLAVNCGGIPADLLESELFGHKKGAFTGALTDKDGLWTVASAGTLFLDEIGDLSRRHQVKILRALEDGEYLPVGGTEEIESNARIIAASNRDLAYMVSTGRFRDDLYYRLFTFRIRTPALREHPDDIPELAQHFWKAIAAKEYKPLPASVTDELKNYRWPGNARELRAFLINVFMVADSRPVTLPMVHAVMRERLGPAFRSQKDQ